MERRAHGGAVGDYLAEATVRFTASGRPQTQARRPALTTDG